MKKNYTVVYGTMLESGEMTIAEVFLLSKIIEYDNSYISIKELAKYMKTSNSRTVQMITSLKRKGFLKTEYNYYNQQKKRIFVLTDKTKELIRLEEERSGVLCI